jgi:hypothetical protein
LRYLREHSRYRVNLLLLLSIIYLEQRCQSLPGKTIAMIVGLLALMLFIPAYYLALGAYQVESEDQRSFFLIGDENQSDRVDVEARIVSLDPFQGEGKLRLVLLPNGNLSHGFFSTKTLKLLSPGAVKTNGLGETVFEKDRILTPVDLIYSMDGQASDYPFDVHSAMIVLAINQTNPERSVPFVLWFKGNVPGFAIDLQPIEGLPPGIRAVNLTVTRSSTVVNAALAGMVVMWAIGIGVLALIGLMLTGWFNIRMPALFAALLFGLFSLRNSLPGTPPIGTYSDFLAFLWVQGIVALALIVAVVATLKHRPT